MLSAFAAPLSLVCAAGHAPPGFYPLGVWCPAAPRGFFLLAVPLGGQSGLCSSSSRSASLQASGLEGGGGGGLLPLDLRGSGVGTVSFRPFSDGCLSLHWQAWRDRGSEPWVVVVLGSAIVCPSSAPLHFQCSAPYTFLQPHFHLGCCSGGDHLRGSGVGTVSFRPFSDGCLSLHWQAWRDRGSEPWVVVVLRFGYCLPFLGSPPFSMLRSLYFLTAPLPSRVLLWRRSPSGFRSWNRLLPALF